MTLTLEEVLFSAVRLISYKDDEPLDFGTGFLLSRPIKDEFSQIFLITNKHILNPEEIDSFKVRFREDKRVEISSLEKIIAHETEDIAIYDVTRDINENHIIDYKVANDSILATFEEPELNVTSQVTFIGYPDSKYDMTNNLPLARTGIIASHPKYDFNGHPVFVIDAQVYPGSSGSPVYVNITTEGWRMGKYDFTQSITKLIGVLSHTITRQQVTSTLEKNLKDEIGLGQVVKSTVLKRLLDTIPIPEL